MAKSKKCSEKQKQHYKQYKANDTWLKNKIARLEKHCKKNPEDLQAAKVLKDGNFSYCRNSFKNLKKEPPNFKLKLYEPYLPKGIKEQLIENGFLR